MSTLVTLPQVYHADVLQRLRDQRVTSASDIEWLRVLRHYMEGDILARCGYASLRYGLEYMGNSPR